MKQVKNAISVREVESTIVASHRYYGFINAGQRGFITRENYREGSYVARCLTCLTEGNGWSDDNYTDLASFINVLVAQGWVIYEFATYHELMGWILEEKEEEF